MREMVSEKQIRNFLKEHLSLIRPGLKLVDTEVIVPNAHGSPGKIDILARDTDGYHVLIELKANRHSSREAMQQSAKYVHLFAEQSGIARARLRSVILSTDWNELIAPFTELKRAWPCELIGYSFKISPDA